MDTKFTIGQITELQREEEKRLANGAPGYFTLFRDLLNVTINQGCSLLENSSQQMQQSWHLWELGWGKALGYKTYREYLHHLPNMPDWPPGFRNWFDRVILVDPIPLQQACQLLDVEVPQELDETFEPVQQEPYWMFCQGDLLRCRELPVLNEFEVGLTAFEGLALLAQSRQIIWYNAGIRGYYCIEGQRSRTEIPFIYNHEWQFQLRLHYLIGDTSFVSFATKGVVSPSVRVEGTRALPTAQLRIPE